MTEPSRADRDAGRGMNVMIDVHRGGAPPLPVIQPGDPPPAMLDRPPRP